MSHSLIAARLYSLLLLQLQRPPRINESHAKPGCAAGKHAVEHVHAQRTVAQKGGGVSVNR